MRMSPLDSFLERAPWAKSADQDSLRRTLEQGLSQAHAANPEISGDLPEFMQYLAERLTPDGPVLDELASLYFGDLYLAWALVRGDHKALVRFDREYIAKVKGFINKALLPPPGELEQALLTKLLVAVAGEKPKIVAYSGRGPLGAWVRMIATRLALDLRRRAPAALGSDGSDVPEVSSDPELDYLKQRYAGIFNSALEEALSALNDRDATLLKLSFIDGISAGAIGTMYGVSSRTVQRWVADIREMVRARTSEVLRNNLSLSGKEVESLLGLMQSRLHVSLHRVLELRGGPLSGSAQS
jgi:RNA polymerase sigma-70 factor (ECF subfamily)